MTNTALILIMLTPVLIVPIIYFSIERAYFKMCLAIALLCISFFIVGQQDKIFQADKERQLVEWKAKGCPAYTTECGKSHYRCEIKVDSIGNFIIDGDIIVTSHKTC